MDFKIGDTVKILRTTKSNAPNSLAGKIGKVTSCSSANKQPYCTLDIHPGGIYNEDLKLVNLDWDE